MPTHETITTAWLAVSRAAHAGRRWQPLCDYRFAAGHALAPLVAEEMPRAALSMPLAFLREGETCRPVAVLGLVAGQNAFVTREGRWLGAYVPSFFRGHPFALRDDGTGRWLLGIDEAALRPEGATDGEAFFAADGAPAPALAEILAFLQQVAKGRSRTQDTCRLLAEHGLLVPWPLAADKGAAREAAGAADGLFRIDEAALSRLDGGALKALAESGALMPAYCQLFSMPHAEMLAQLVQAQANTGLPMAIPGDGVESLFFCGSDTIPVGA